MAVPLKELSELLKNFRDFKGLGKITLKEEGDITDIPVVTREDLANFGLEKCPQRPVEIGATSGSTGRNLYVFFSRKCQEMKERRLRQILEINKVDGGEIVLNMMSYGMQLSANILECSLLGSENPVVPLGGSDETEKIRILSHILDKMKPGVVFSTTSLLSLFLDENIYRGECIKKCFASGEVLLPEFRKLIEDRKIKLYNFYGCCETGYTAVQEDPRDEFMRILDGLYVEVIKPNGEISETGRGEILLTDLFNFSSPIIRYRIGDESEVIERGGKKYMRIFGRRDNFTNINESVISNNLIIGKIIETLGHNNFFVKIFKNYKIYQDFVMVNLRAKDMKHIKHVKVALGGIGINCPIIFRKTEKAVPKTITGKMKHIIDARKLKLKDKNLNW